MKAKKRPLKTLSVRAKQRAKYMRTVIEPTRRLAELLAEAQGYKTTTLRRRSA